MTEQPAQITGKLRAVDGAFRWLASGMAALLVSSAVNMAVAFLFGNGNHGTFIRRFFFLSEVLFQPGFEGGIYLVAGNVFIFAVPLTILFALVFRRSAH